MSNLGGTNTTGLVYNEQISGDVANQRANVLGDYPVQDLPIMGKAFKAGVEGLKAGATAAVLVATGGAAAPAVARTAAGAAAGRSFGASAVNTKLGAKFAQSKAGRFAAGRVGYEAWKPPEAEAADQGPEVNSGRYSGTWSETFASRQSSTGRPASHAYTRPAGGDTSAPTGTATGASGPFATQSARRAGFSQGSGGIQDAEVVGETPFPTTPVGGASLSPGFPTTPTAPAISTPAMPRLQAFSMGALGAGPPSPSKPGTGPTSTWPRTGMGMKGKNRIASSLAGWNADNT